AVQVPKRRHRNPESVIVGQGGPAIGAAGYLDRLGAVHRGGAGGRDGEGVVLDLAIAGRAGGAGRGGGGAQPEPRLGGTRRARGDGRERQGEPRVAAAGGDGHAGPLGGAVEGAVVVVVDPAVQRGGCARAVAGQQRHRGGGALGAQQVQRA